MTKLHSTRLLVQSFAACFDFYGDTLGLQLVYGNRDDAYAEFKSGGAHLAIFERKLMAQVVGTLGLPAHPGGQDTFCLSLSTQDVDARYRELVEKGVEGVTEPQDRPEWGIRTAHIRDPDGNLIELNSPLNASDEAGQQA